jgi:hypothetical protein
MSRKIAASSKRERFTTADPTWRPANVKNVEVADQNIAVVIAAIAPSWGFNYSFS